MSRIFWDTMLFIYLLEENPSHSGRVLELLTRARKRGDSLFTSYLALGEIVAGAEKSSASMKESIVRGAMREMGFTCLPFDAGAVGPFSILRSRNKLKVADSIHLASAASAGIDLFLTGDRELAKIDIPGIQFIADFNNPVL